MRCDETGLDAVRREQLSPENIIALLIAEVWVLLRVGIGVGKSFAIDALIRSEALRKYFDLVLVFAPTWDVLREREFVRDPSKSPVRVVVVQPRPVERCGAYAKPWAKLESRGCSALAKATLCKECQLASPDDACTWPDQLSDLKGTGLFFAPEQHLHLNPSFVGMLILRTGAARTLVILDEGKFLDGSFEITITHRELTMFADCLDELADPDPKLADHARTWAEAVREIIQASSRGVQRLEIDLPFGLISGFVELQRVGVRRFGPDFRFLGYDLFQLKYSRRQERRKTHDKTLIFTARPFLHTHVLIASAHLDPDFVAHRLGTSRIASPFSDLLVRHSGTRIRNLRSRLGADKYFWANHKQVLDTHAVIIARNILEGRSTLLVCRLKSKPSCAAYLTERLKGWGLDVRFVIDGGELPTPPDPRVVPIIHYGVLGTNSYTEYECVLCLNSYYVSGHALNKAIRTAEPCLFATDVRIVSHGTLERRIELVNPMVPDVDRRWLAELYLRRLEIDPVIQAVGRARFLTHPREVVFFQMADLSRELGEIDEVRSLAALQHRAARVAAGKSVRTANLEVDSFKAMLNWALRAGLIAANPIVNMPRLPERESTKVYRRRALSEEEITRFLRAAREDDRANAERAPRVPQTALWRVLLECGPRYGETVSTTWADLDVEAGVLCLRAETTKARRERRIPLRRDLVDELVALKAAHIAVLRRPLGPRDRVFLSPQGQPWSWSTVNLGRILHRVLEAAGIDRKDPSGRTIDVHALRHSAATRMARNGVPLAVTQRILGHSDPKLTSKVYQHLEVEDLRSAVEQLAPEHKKSTGVA